MIKHIYDKIYSKQLPFNTNGRTNQFGPGPKDDLCGLTIKHAIWMLVKTDDS
jgi:hypothetical protein